MKAFIYLFISLFFLSIQGKGQQVGDSAPDFTLQQIQGGNFTLSNQTGKVVFIFWLGYACPYCKSAAPSISSDIINTFNGRSNFVAIGVDTWNGSKTQVEGFKSQTGLDVNYLMMGSSAAQSWGTTYDRLSVVDKNGKIVFKGTQGSSLDIGNAKTAIENALSVTTSAETLEGNVFELSNYPNPFSSQTTIRFQLKKNTHISLGLYDLTGKKVRKITDKPFSPGEHQVIFSKEQLTNGIYFLRLNAEGQVFTRKMIIR